MTETAETLKEAIEILTPYLGKLADSIGNNGSYMFGVLVKQVYIQGIVMIFDSILWFVLGYIYYRVVRRVYKWCTRPVKNRWGEETTWVHANDGDGALVIGVMLVIGIVLFELIIFSISEAEQGIIMLINPEYNAITQLLHVVH